MPSHFLSIVAITGILILVSPLRAESNADTVTFNAHIRPIFSDKCFACHGFDQKKRKANLRLDTQEGAYASLEDSPGHAIVPGKPEESEVWHRIITTDQDDLMPPEEFHKPIGQSERALIKRWIEQGAKYEEHWAYRPIEKPAVAELKQHGAKAANPIDVFVLKRLEEKDIQPTGRAPKRTLLRRLSLDLTGLPPTPAEMDSFLNDSSEGAYQKQVDRLLASPRFGERMAVPWLDVARYADTVGFHGDQNQHIFPYRDYVINAYNNNLRFDQFTIEQLAGDLLENPTDEQRVATGFVRLSQMTREGGAQPKEYLAKYASDRVRAVGAAWLGQTTGCAECHDHKFDPITAKDFYSLSAFFKDIKQWGVYSDYKYTPNPDLKGYNNDYPFPPEITIESPSLLSRLRNLREVAHQQNAAKAKLPSEWEDETRQYLGEYPSGWATARATDVTSSKATPARVLDDGAILFTGAAKKDDTIAVTLSPEPGHFTAFQLELLPHLENGNLVGRGSDGEFALNTPTFAVSRGGDGKEIPLSISWSQADYFFPEKYQSGSPPLALPKVWRPGNLRWSLPDDFQRRSHSAVFILKTPEQLREGDLIHVTLQSSDVGCVRISTTRFAEPVAGQAAVEPDLIDALKKSPESRTAQQQSLIAGTWSLAHLPANQLNPEWPALQQSIRECRSGIARSLIALTTPGSEVPVTRILPRGDWQNESGDVVEPAVLHFLPQPEAVGKRKLTRLDLARWLVSDDNPLTARHVMNRYWKQFFGNGLSNILDDLGSQGEWPSHPELLDWLAFEFRNSGWDTKHMIKLMVISNTYQQESGTRRDLEDLDPYNRLLARQSPRRLEAEFIRDNALAISGLLNTDYTGGPSVFPYQPPDYYAPLQFPDRQYVVDHNGDQYRRGVYMHWQRTFLHPMLANFDAPSREECSADRLQTNNPLQALTLLNDPASVEMARSFSLLLLESETMIPARLEKAFQRTVSRSPREDEKQSLTSFIETQLNHYRERPDDAAALLKSAPLPQGVEPAEAAAWTQVCRVLLNLHETITRY